MQGFVMKKRMNGKGLATAIAAASLASLALAGCGGGGGSSSPAQATSPFAGNYVGTFTDTGNSQSGTITATVSTDGQVTGSSHNTTLNSDGPFTGSVDNSGNASFNIVNSKGTFTDKGTVAFASNGHLDGTLTEYNGSTQVGTAIVDLVKQ